MKKQLNTSTLENELKGASLFFGTPAHTSIEGHAQPILSATDPRKHGNNEPRNPVSKEPRERGTIQPRILGNTETGKPLPTPPTLVVATTFDLNQLADNKYTLAFTIVELEALDDLKRTLRRSHGLKVAKNDLVRAALHHLIEDFQRLGSESLLMERLRSKRGR